MKLTPRCANLWRGGGVLLVLLLTTTLAASAQEAAAPVAPEQPLTLDDCVKLALELSPRLSTAAAQLRSAQAGLLQASSVYTPNLRLTWDWATGDNTTGGTAGAGASTGTRQSLAASLSQTFYQSGAAEDIGSARAGATSARWDETDARRQVVLDVTQGYYAVLAAREFADVAKRAVRAATQHLDAANARISAGTAPRADRLPFEVELQQALLAAISTDRQSKLALNDLRQDIGLPVDAALELAPAPGQPPLPGEVGDLRALALSRRPDLLSARSRVEGARLSLRAAVLQRGPTLSAGGSDSYGLFDDVTGNNWELSVGVSWPVFNIGSVKAAQDSARASLDLALANLRQAELQVGYDVENTYLSAVEASARIEAASAAVASARLSLEAAQEKYQSGLGTVIDVTDAEQKLRQAEADEVQARYDHRSSVAGLDAAVGRADLPQEGTRP